MKTVDVVGVGVALVDNLAYVGDQQLESMDLTKGTMQLIDHTQLQRICAEIKPDTIQSGGSVANTIVQMASLGSRCEFIGKIADDKAGERFGRDMTDAGVRFATTVTQSSKPSGQCYVFVSKDAQRTMCTHLGAATDLSVRDVDVQSIASAHCLLVEGYLWDSSDAIQLIEAQTSIATANETRIALTLSDPLLVERHRRFLQAYVESYVDILICNEHEALQLYQSATLEEAISLIRTKVSIAVITRGAQGSEATRDDQKYVCEAAKASRVRDTTGAGDAYAAGFLHGLSKNLPVPDCMKIGSDLAALVIQHIGGRR